jgi:hypothetical protein
MVEWWRSYPSGQVHALIPGTAYGLCGAKPMRWVNNFPPGCRRCQQCLDLYYGRGETEA